MAQSSTSTNQTAQDSTIPRSLQKAFVLLVTGLLILSTGTVQVTLGDGAVQSPPDPNDTTPLEPRTEVSGTVGVLDPTDWYTFDAQQGQQITVRVGLALVNYQLIGPSGEVLDTAGVSDYSITGEQADPLQATAQQSGTHYVKVSVAGVDPTSTNPVSYITGNEYTLRLSLLSGDGANDNAETGVSDTDNAETAATQNATAEFAEFCDAKDAQPVTAGTYSNLLSPTDRDVLMPNISEGEYITVNLSYDGPEGTHLLVYGLTKDVSFSAMNGSPPRQIPHTVKVFAGGENRLTVANLYKEPVDERRVILLIVEPGTTQFRAYAQSNSLCIAFQNTGDTFFGDTGGVIPFKKSSAGGAGTWELAFNINNATSPNIISANQTTS